MSSIRHGTTNGNWEKWVERLEDYAKVTLFSNCSSIFSFLMCRIIKMKQLGELKLIKMIVGTLRSMNRAREVFAKSKKKNFSRFNFKVEIIRNSNWFVFREIVQKRMIMGLNRVNLAYY